MKFNDPQTAWAYKRNRCIKHISTQIKNEQVELANRGVIYPELEEARELLAKISKLLEGKPLK